MRPNPRLSRWIPLIAALSTADRLAAQPPALSGVRDFVYQLQNIDPAAIGRTGFDLAVVDYSEDGSDEAAFPAEDIEAMRSAPGGGKIVLSYLSIGEAENYRFYWRAVWGPGNPPWLDAENPEWEGNYKVRFWDPGWQAIVFRYVDRILAAGFDGVYCDLVDAYEAYEEGIRPSAADDMAAFVAAIREYGRSARPGFLVFVQNAAELGGRISGYLDALDGIGQEDCYYGYEEDGVETPPEITGELERALRVFRDAGKPVLTIDYPFAESESVPHFDGPTRAKIDRAYRLSAENGFIPYCTVRDLGALTVNPGHEPSSVECGRPAAHPAAMGLLANFPNPFNTATEIQIQIQNPGSLSGPGFGDVLIEILDTDGRVVARPHSGPVKGGLSRCVWDGTTEAGNAAASGLYWVRLLRPIGGPALKITLLR
jgi:cysteinyl-tRNA synthetase, unknown class